MYSPGSPERRRTPHSQPPPFRRTRALWIEEVEEAVCDGSWGELVAVLSQDGGRPLHTAIAMENVDAVRTLLEKCDPDELDDKGRTPLEVCACHVDGTIARQRPFGLVDAPPLAVMEEDDDEFYQENSDLPIAEGDMFLRGVHLAGAAVLPATARSAPVEMAQLLLRAGAGTASTALLRAARCQDPALGKLFLAFGADPNTPGSDGTTPLWHASMCSPGLLGALLLANADPLVSVGDLLPVDVAVRGARPRLLLATRWRYVRLFVLAWARQRPDAKVEVVLADLPQIVCSRVMEFLSPY